MDFEKLASEIGEFENSARVERERINERGRQNDQYIESWRLLEDGLTDWSDTGDDKALRKGIRQLSDACDEFLGVDWLTKVSQFSEFSFDNEPGTRISARQIKCILGILESERDNHETPLPDHSLFGGLQHHLHYVRYLVEAGKPKASCCRCGSQLWVDQFSEGHCGCKPVLEHSQELPANELSEAAGQTGGSSDVPDGGSSASSTDPGEKSFEDLMPSEQKAYLSFKLAESVNGCRMQNKPAWEWLLNNDWSEYTGKDPGLLDGYTPPSFVTWSRQMREARRVMKEQKYVPRKK